jgi:DNA-directed RNA polymerase subunit alpha
METSLDLRAVFEQDEFTQESYDALRRLGFSNRDSLDRLQDHLLRLVERANAAEGKPGMLALKVGVCNLVLSRLNDAIRWLEKAEDGKFRNYFLGRALLDRGRHQAAAACFVKAAAQGWNAVECDALRAEGLLLAGDEAEAARILAGHAAEGEASAQWLYANGRLAQQRGDLDAAIEYYEKALEIDDEHAWALFHLAYLLDLHGSDERARDLYHTCTTLPFVHANAMLNMAIIHEDSAEFEKAARCLRRLLAVDPDNARARLYLKDVLAAGEMYIDEVQVKEQERQSAVLDIPVTDFELSVRSRNCLKKMNIMTLGDLLRTTEAELLAYKNFGETSLKEIKAMLSQKGLSLGQNAGQTGAASPAPAPVGDPILGDPEVLSRSVSTLELSVRARKCLQRLNINTLGELANRSETELLEARNFGQTSLNEIKGRLRDLGLILKDQK